MLTRKRFLPVALLALLLTAGPLLAGVQIASPFTSHMVLQCDQKVPVWGTAEPGEKVTVEFAGQKKLVKAGTDGKWRADLDAMAVSAEGRVLTVSGSHTAQPIKLDDVLVGEVWLCSGQSNMDFTVAKTEKYYFAGVTNEAAEVAAANYPRIRMFSGEWTRSYTPCNTIAGTWKVCTPENVREFSAIGYFFARDLQKELNVPIGILTLTYGASTAQAWIRREAIAANPKLKPALDEFDAKAKAHVPPTGDELKQWQAAVDQAKAAGNRPPRRPKPNPDQDQHNPTVLFNGMIAPVVPCAVRGVLWYQGESITPPKELFPLWNETLITDWRKLWGRELPFYFCQLAALRNSSNDPQVREWQAAALAVPKTAMAVTIDIGDEKNVHPKDKQDVGDRLTRIALANVYGHKMEYSGPVYESMKVEGNAIRLKFSHLGGGLVAKNGPLQTFEIAGADQKFVPAETKIDGNTLLVSSASVTNAVAVRYAWSSYPEGCNFYNAAGLPAPPFRTDAPKSNAVK
jgi:sialate O-acetylesterase